jgi:hypothetical protein
MLLKKHVRRTYYLNNLCFSHAKRHMSILYMGCMKFPTNRFEGNLCPWLAWYKIERIFKIFMRKMWRKLFVNVKKMRRNGYQTGKSVYIFCVGDMCKKHY